MRGDFLPDSDGVGGQPDVSESADLTSPLTLHLRIPNLRQRLNEQKRERGICKLLRCRIIFARTITSLFIKIEARIWIGGLFESLGDSHFFLRGKDLISEHRKLHRC